MRASLTAPALPILLALTTGAAAQPGERFYDCGLADGSRIGFAVDPGEKTVRRPEGPVRRASEFSDTRIAASLRTERIEFDPASGAVVVTPIVEVNGFRLPEFRSEVAGRCVSAAAWGEPPPYRQALARPEEGAESIVTLAEPEGQKARLEVLGGPETAPPGRDGVIVRSVNLRAGPSRGAPTIRILDGGSRVAVVSCDGWCRIEADGREGWVYRDFLRIAGR